MTTLTDEQRRNLLQQIQAAQQQVSSLYQQAGFTPPPPVAPLNVVSLNAAQMGGSSGVGFEDTETQGQISKQLQTGSEQGMSSAKTKDVSSGSISAPAVMSREQAEFALRGAGLAGLIDARRFVGMTPEQAQQAIQAERQRRLGQTSQLTSFAFNPETLAATRKLMDRINFTLTDVNKDPFKSQASKSEQIRSILSGGAREMAALFNSPQEFQQALASNPELQKQMQSFEAMGGNLNDVSTNIIPKTAQVSTDTIGYLDNLYNPQANQQAVQMAQDEMFPERMIAQQEIARQVGLAQNLVSLYFGTEDQVGLLEMKRSQAEEQKRIIEQQEKDQRIALEKRARLAIDKNNAEMQIQIAKIEENRLAAKNYMTGMLAKLGALQTTGAAPQALQTLETKYQIAAQQMEMQFKFANKEIELGLDEALNELVTQRDSRILKVEQDLTKDYEDIMKEIMKIEQASEKEIYRITEQYARRLRERTTKYTTDLQKEAEKYVKSFGKIAGGGVDLFALSKTVNGTLGRASTKTAITSSATQVKTDIRNNLPANVANRIINDLNDEQLRLFLDDYLNERVSRQQSFNPLDYFEKWKAEYGIKQPKQSTTNANDELDLSFLD